jgi:hypothetical protein
MALTASELNRCKAELGYNLIGVNQPYIGTTSIFEQVIQPYLLTGAITTSSTVVAEQTEPMAVTLTLASATGFSQFDRVIVDVDGAQEAASVRAISGSSITLLLSGAHSGTYPVTVEAGEAIVRENLRRIMDVKANMGEVFGEGQLKKVDEVEFYQSPGNLFGNLGSQLTFWRNELAACLGITSMWQQRAAAGQRLAVY